MRIDEGMGWQLFNMVWKIGERLWTVALAHKGFIIHRNVLLNSMMRTNTLMVILRIRRLLRHVNWPLTKLESLWYILDSVGLLHWIIEGKMGCLVKGTWSLNSLLQFLNSFMSIIL